MPASLDPGVHTISVDGESVVLRRTAMLESFIEPLGSTTVELEIRIRAAKNPLRHLRGPSAHNDTSGFAGYTSEVTIRQTTSLPILAEAWNLVQIPAGGVALVSTVPEAQVTDYYEPVGDLLTHIPGGVAVAITGADRFKLGFAAPHVLGRVGYLRARPAGNATFLLRNSLSDPAAEYSEEPDFAPGHRGDPIHIYNDDGGLGGFAELEARGRPIGTPDVPASSTDPVTSWWFRGDALSIAAITRSLTGIDAASIESFTALDEHSSTIEEAAL